MLTPTAQSNLIKIEQCLEKIRTANREKDIEKLAKYTEQLDKVAYEIMIEVYFLNKKLKKQQTDNRWERNQ